MFEEVADWGGYRRRDDAGSAAGVSVDPRNATGVAHGVGDDGRWLGLPSSPAAADDAVPARCPYCKTSPPPRLEAQSATFVQLADDLEQAMATVRSLATEIKRRWRRWL